LRTSGGGIPFFIQGRRQGLPQGRLKNTQGVGGQRKRRQTYGETKKGPVKVQGGGPGGGHRPSVNKKKTRPVDKGRHRRGR